ncbi:MAG: hypothetical protein JRI71_10210 [Deltaproteobacteria bacterium]|nr:hypothetical protein [Deltaproteobacteria bacterium]
MAFPVDPMKAKYYPEVFGESGIVENSVSGTEIASYSGYGDYIVQLVSLATGPETTDHSSIRVNSDAGSNLINSATEARFYADKHEEMNVTGVESLALYCYAAASSPSDVPYQYGIRVTKPTVYEKLLLGIELTDIEEAMNTKFAIQKKIKAGILSGQTAQPYTKIYEVARRLTSLADVNPTVGQVIHPLAGRKVVLLGIAMDDWATANAVFVNVTRDGEQVMKLDAAGFPEDITDNTGGATTYTAQSNYELPLHIVATDKLRVWIENTAALTGPASGGFNVRFKYGIATLTIIEKIRWGLPITDEENTIASEFDLFDAVTAGVT